MPRYSPITSVTAASPEEAQRIWQETAGRWQRLALDFFESGVTVETGYGARDLWEAPTETDNRTAYALGLLWNPLLADGEISLKQAFARETSILQYLVRLAPLSEKMVAQIAQSDADLGWDLFLPISERASGLNLETQEALAGSPLLGGYFHGQAQVTLAGREDLLPSVAVMLYERNDQRVNEALHKNPVVTPELANSIALTSVKEMARAAVADRQDLSLDAYLALASDSYELARQRIVNNPTPPDYVRIAASLSVGN